MDSLVAWRLLPRHTISPRKIFNPPFVVRTPYLIVLGGFTGVVAYFYGMVSCSQPIVRGFLIEKSAETQHPQQPIQVFLHQWPKGTEYDKSAVHEHIYLNYVYLNYVLVN